tara:strand:- start:1771 stop:3012 length:1242 start_codon:yes stop_codon:yes gene_type:complete
MIGKRDQGTKKKSRLGFFIGFFFVALILVISLGLFWLNRQSLDQPLLSSFDGLIEDLNGYVLLEFFKYSLETSVPILILGMLLAYVLIRILILIWRSPRIIREMLANRSAKRTQRLLNDSLILLSKGDTRRAKKKLKSASSTNHPILQSFLLNIKMSIDSGDIAESHNWVEKASTKLPQVKDYIYIFASKLLIDAGYSVDARSYIDELIESNPKNSTANQLLFRILKDDRDYDLILRKIFEFSDYINDDELAHTILSMVKDAIKRQKPTENILDRIPRSIDKHPIIVTSKIEAWIDNKEYLKAETELRKQIPNNWNKELILLYAELGDDKVNELSERIDKWLEERPKDTTLWLVASRLAQKDGLWSKAQQCIERSIEISPSSETYTELALVLSELGEKQQASEALKLARQTID